MDRFGCCSVRYPMYIVKVAFKKPFKCHRRSSVVITNNELGSTQQDLGD